MEKGTQYNIQLLAIEKIALTYWALTLILTICFWQDIPLHVVTSRICILLTTLVLAMPFYQHSFLRYAFGSRSVQITYYLRIFFQVGLLAFWYPDIYEFARFMPDADHIFAQIDQWIFGCQPSLMFSKWLSGFWWQELFNMGYFSYYLMIVGLVIASAWKGKKELTYTASMMVGCFMLYYVIFLFVESAGPQYYFQHIGEEQVLNGVFPNIGNWFQTHSELVHKPLTQKGLFVTLVHQMQQSEMPIAAFPSSHVGLSTVMVLLAWKLNRKLAYIYLPFYVILCASTVYIGAHYAIDVLGGWATSIIIFYAMHKIVLFLLKKENGTLIADEQ